MTILGHITELIAQKGSGFYCIVTTKEEITDVVKVIADGLVIKSIQIHGDKQVYGAEDIANMIEMEGANDGFLFLNDIISIPQPTDEDIARVWGDSDKHYDEFRAKIISMDGREISDAEMDKHYANALKDGNGNDETRSTGDLIGYENMDYTIGANDHVNKDKEIE